MPRFLARSFGLPKRLGRLLQASGSGWLTGLPSVPKRLGRLLQGDRLLEAFLGAWRRGLSRRRPQHLGQLLEVESAWVVSTNSK